MMNMSLSIIESLLLNFETYSNRPHVSVVEVMDLTFFRVEKLCVVVEMSRDFFGVDQIRCEMILPDMKFTTTTTHGSNQMDLSE